MNCRLQDLYYETEILEAKRNSLVRRIDRAEAKGENSAEMYRKYHALIAQINANKEEMKKLESNVEDTISLFQDFNRCFGNAFRRVSNAS